MAIDIEFIYGCRSTYTYTITIHAPLSHHLAEAEDESVATPTSTRALSGKLAQLQKNHQLFARLSQMLVQKTDQLPDGWCGFGSKFDNNRLSLLALSNTYE